MAESRKSMLKGSEKGSLPGTFAAVDLKSFYASVECMARGLDPMKAYLVVADESRTEKTICLASLLLFSALFSVYTDGFVC